MFKIIESIPDWAASYLVNDDPSSLEEEDIKLVDDFCDKLFQQGYRLVCPTEDDQSYFTWHPAFGLACNVSDWYAEVMKNE